MPIAVHARILLASFGFRLQPIHDLLNLIVPVRSEANDRPQYSAGHQ